MPKRVYISGPIKGVSNYRSKFDHAEQKFTNTDYKVINPAYMDEVMPVASYEEYMKVDMYLLSMCDAIYMLDGWETSCGANREYGYALAKGMEIMFEEEPDSVKEGAS